MASHHSSKVRKLTALGALLALLVWVVVSGYRYRAQPPADRSLASGVEGETEVSKLWHTVATGTLMAARHAQRELQQLARSSVKLHLVDRLSHENWRVRAVAVSVIRTCGMKQYIPCLISRLSDVNWRVRYAAAVTLEGLTGQSYGAFGTNTPLEVREQTILKWHEHWISSDPDDGWLELWDWYAASGHLEIGSTLAGRLFGSDVSSVPGPASDDEYPLRVEAAVTDTGEAQAALTLVVTQPPGSTAPIEAGSPLRLTVRFLDHDNVVLDTHSVPYEPHEQRDDREVGATFTFPLPADTEVVEYAMVLDTTLALDGAPARRSSLGRIRLQDASPFLR